MWGLKKQGYTLFYLSLLQYDYLFKHWLSNINEYHVLTG